MSRQNSLYHLYLLSFYSIVPLLSITTAQAQINPNGAGTVVNTVVNPQGNQINITGGTQAGANLFHSFRDFNVNSAQIANFLSNPQIQNILARVNGGNPSFINGLLQVTGGNSNLFLMNPAGIVFGQGASLNVTASFTATTANQIGFGNNLFNAFGDNNFSALIGNPDSFLFTTNQAGSIVNAGNLSVRSGQGINLIGGNIVNTGNLNAGNITLAAVPGTNRVRISQPGHILSLEIIPPVDSVITPLDLPRLLTGSDLPGITTNGETIQVAGVTIPTGQGINITSGNLSLASPLPMGEGLGVRAINILGDRVALINANLNASGINGGGTIRVGGEYRGGGVNPFNSRITYVNSNSFLSADAINSGNGGRVIIWADDTTRFYGNISARGGANAGNGGFAEVSGAQVLTFGGQADLSAPRGSFGTLLLDPVNIFINNGADALGGCTLPTVAVGCSAGDITISQATLQALPAAANVVLEASNNITIGTLTGNTLTFANAPGGSITFRADFDGNGAGDFVMNAGDTIRSPGRNITINAANLTTGNVDTSTGTVAQNGGSITLTATTGNVSARNITAGSIVNSGNAGNGANISISAVNGNVSTGDVDSRSVVVGNGNSGNAGNIAINAQRVTTEIVTAYSLIDNGVSGNGGNITIMATNGSINAMGMTAGSGASIIGSGASGNAGNVTIDATNDITISGAIIPQISPSSNPIGIDTRSLANGSTAGNGGNIRINQNLFSSGIFTSGGDINSFSAANVGTGTAGNAGNIFLTAQRVSVNIMNAASIANIGNASNGGNIQVTANNGTLNATAIVASAVTAGAAATTGNGGNITINTTNNVIINSAVFPEIGSVTPLSLDTRSSGLSGNAGTINLSSGGQIFSGGGLYANSNSGIGGAINLSSSGDILTYSLSTENAIANLGGSINISATNLFRATGSFTNRNGILSSISTAGGMSGGAITITHGGSNSVPFVVGSATSNGTTSAITSGLSTNTVNNLTVLVPPAINNYGTNISIRTIDNPPITPGLLLLFTNPAPPPTPEPVVVGTPPVAPSPSLQPDPVVELPIAIASPSPLPSPTPLPLPNPTLSSLANPTSSPATSSPQTNSTSSSATNPTFNSSLTLPLRTVPNGLGTSPDIININPQFLRQDLSLFSGTLSIITSPTNDEISARIGRLEQQFQSEFQQYLGITARISTGGQIDLANPNQPVNSQLNSQYSLPETQNKLNRITETTKAKPALVYVFFAPPDGSNNVNSASLAAQTTRAAKDDDPLEVILITGKSRPLRVRFPRTTRRQVLEVANEFRSEVTNFRSSRGFLIPAKQMYAWILDSLEAELQEQGIDNLVFLMDAGLRSIPLAALHDGQGFIVERYSVGLMPSLNLTEPTYNSLEGSQVLAMGATNFTNSGLNPLPAVSLELNTISQLWQGSEFLNDRFTLFSLIQQRQDRPFRMIHLATHAVFSPGDRANSYIQLWDRKLSLDQLDQLNWGNPPVDLLVLSACQTALGDYDAELGFAGLAINAGVRSALASLWQVNDVATLGLMTNFYQQLQITTTKSEALRQAQLAMIRREVRLEEGNLVTVNGVITLPEELRDLQNLRLNHPYYWSAFTMVGNPW